MKKLLLLSALALATTLSNAQKKVTIWGGAPFSPAAWDASEMRFSEYEGKHFPFLSDEVYWGHKTLIFDISEANNCYAQVMNGWWTARYDDNVNVNFVDGNWALQITEEIAQDCARGMGGAGKDLTLMVTNGSCTINEVYYIDDEIFLPNQVARSTERLDSIVTPGYSKEENEYDADGIRTRYTNYTWDANLGDWANSTKFEYAYETKEDLPLVSSVKYGWDKSKNDWTITSKSEYAYDANDNQIMSATYAWNEAYGTWTGIEKNETAYDQWGNQTLWAYYQWNSEKLDWECSSMSELAYDENGQETLKASYSWDTEHNALIGESKEEWEYDAKGNMTLSNYYNWSYSQWDWELSSTTKDENTYDEESGLLLSHAAYRWNPDTNDWEMIIKGEYTYDETGKKTLGIEYSFDKTSQEWYPSYKYEYSYDENGFYSQFVCYMRFDINEDWRGIAKDDIVSDERGNMLSCISWLWATRGADNWVQSTKVEKAFDANNNQTFLAQYEWDRNTEEWYGNEKWEKAFDDYNNETSATKYMWNSSAKDWSVATMSAATYDTTVAGENVLGIYTNSKLLTESSTRLRNDAITSQKLSTYHYSPVENAAISQVGMDADDEHVIDLFGLQVDRINRGKVYIRGNAKVMMR